MVEEKMLQNKEENMLWKKEIMILKCRSILTLLDKE